MDAVPPMADTMEDECQFEPGSGRNVLAYRVGGLFGILVAGLIGYVLPFIFSNRFKSIFFLFQSFAAGIVLAVGIVHVLPEATEMMSSPCLNLSTTFPWGPVLALMAALLTFIFEHSLKIFIRDTMARKGSNGLEANVSLEGGPLSARSLSPVDKELDFQNRRVIAYTLEAGIVFHSVFVGLSLGTSRDTAFVQGLAFALLFHQGFEGIALGAAVVKAGFDYWKACLLGLLFILTCPVGVAIGIGVFNSFNENSKAVLGVTGVFNSLSAGILIYNSLADLLLPAFIDDDAELPRGKLETIFGFGFLLAGGACMSLIAKWA